MPYELIFSKLFEKEFGKLDNSIQKESWKKIEKLKETFNIGKHLHYLDLWELHVQMFRVFYLVRAINNKILILSIKHKDECEKYIKGLKPEEIKLLLSGIY